MGGTDGRTMTGTRARRRISAVVAPLVVAILAAACAAGPSGGTAPLALQVSLAGGGFDLAWQGEVPAGTTFTVQVLGLGPQRPTGWTGDDVGTATTATFSDVVE